MGKQSARLYYDGKDHKDIYFQGNYHRVMYKGDELVWMKLGGKTYIPFVKHLNDGYQIYVYYPDTKSAEKILDIDGAYNFTFNEKFLILYGTDIVSKDGREFLSYDYGAEYYKAAILGGVLGRKSGSLDLYLFYLGNNGNIVNEKLILKYGYYGELLIPITYFREYIFFKLESEVGIIRKDGYRPKNLKLIGGAPLYYAFVNGSHTILVAYRGYLYIYKTKDFLTWTYQGTGIATAVGDSGFGYDYILSCIYDGEKYLIYTISNVSKEIMLLYETYDFENFTNVSLPAYITLKGTKESSICYLYTDKERFMENPPDGDLSFALHHSSFCRAMVQNNTILAYQDGIRMNPHSIMTSGTYIDNLYYQDSDNNMLIDFLEE